MSWLHTPPDEVAIEKNQTREPEGERIRKELIEFLTRNKIVGILLDTAHHTIEVNIDKLPPKLKTVLTQWGAISVVDDTPDWKLGDVVPADHEVRGGRLEWVPPTKPEGWDDNVIPPMTNPLGKHWDQPALSEIVVTSKSATMGQEAFDRLLDYSGSMPTGAYEGKMWRARQYRVDDVLPHWALCWYGYSKIGPGSVSNNHRWIVIKEAE